MSKKLSLITLICFIIGIICGFFVPEIFPHISFLGTVYVNLLKMMIIPVLMTSIVYALAQNHKGTGKIVWKTIITFIVMFIISFLITFIIVSISNPGANFSLSEIAYENGITTTSFSDFFVSIFPSNIFESIRTNSILPVILFSFVLGLAIQKTENNSYIINVLKNLKDATEKMLKYIMYITPIGVFSLIGNSVANFGTTVITQGIVYILIAYACCVAITIFVMILPVWFFCKISPIEYIKKVAPIWINTLSTCSSAATLPTTIKICNQSFGIPDYITSIVVPLGCTIHMCGGAVSFCLLALFNAQLFGIEVTLGMFVIMIMAALLINMGAPGIPGGGIVIGATYLTILGIPLDFMGLYAGIYRVLDMAYTSMNVTGDITANLLIRKMYNGKLL